MNASRLSEILACAPALQSTSALLRVRYGETDKMGVAYYGSYLDWFENGRTELIRSLGLSYRQIEEEGLFLPVRESFCRYRTPLAYDDEFRLTTQLCLVDRYKVVFRNSICLEEKTMAEGGTLHASTDRTGRIIPIPENIKQLLLGTDGKVG